MEPSEAIDRLLIHDLLVAYVTALDARDWEAFPALFTPDAEIDYTSSGGPRGDVPTVLAWLREVLPPSTLSQHLLTNVRIDVDGDAATARAALINPMSFGTPDIMLVGGSYDDRLRRTDAGWRIAERTQHLLWMATMPRVPRWGEWPRSDDGSG